MCRKRDAIILSSFLCEYNVTATSWIATTHPECCEFVEIFSSSILHAELGRDHLSQGTVAKLSSSDQLRDSSPVGDPVIQHHRFRFDRFH
jgi:hypothetical protein